MAAYVLDAHSYWLLFICLLQLPCNKMLSIFFLLYLWLHISVDARHATFRIQFFRTYTCPHLRRVLMFVCILICIIAAQLGGTEDDGGCVWLAAAAVACDRETSERFALEVVVRDQVRSPMHAKLAESRAREKCSRKHYARTQTTAGRGQTHMSWLYV